MGGGGGGGELVGTIGIDFHLIIYSQSPSRALTWFFMGI